MRTRLGNVIDDKDPDIDSGWDERPTVAPPVDPAALARASMTIEDSPLSAPRAPQVTLIDEVSTEQSRKLTLPTRPPPTSRSEGALRRTSLLNLANAASMADTGTPLDLAARRTTDEPAESASAGPEIQITGEYDPVAEMQDRFSLGDYSGSLVIAEAVLSDDPEHPEAKKYAENCRGVLEQMYAARLGALDRVPFVAVAADQLRWLSIDHRSGFVLAHIDGTASLEQILDVSGMPRLDALRIIYELVQHRVVALR